MTPGSPDLSRPGACPDAGLIAAHAERRLSGAEAMRLDEHIAGCASCYEVLAEAIRFGMDEAAAGRGPSVTPLRRPVFTMAALATAAALVLALGLWFSRARPGRVPAPLVAELAEAMGGQRFVEPRLTGGFRHGRVIRLRSGDAPRGLDAQSPQVLAAVARIRARAAGDTSPEALGALAVTYLVSGDPTAAVKALESAVAQDPNDARLQSDLTAAYLVRAADADEPADVPKALESAERAIALEGAPPEAWFNRALALERLHLVDAARKAWQDYLERDASSPWADEARQRLDALPKERKSSAEEDKARVRAALDEGTHAVEKLADEAPQLLRDYFEDELLPAWAEAHLVGHPDARVHRERSRLLGDAVFRATGDTLARDTARSLADHVTTPNSRDPLRSQARGYKAFREAERLYDLQEPSCRAFRDAMRELDSGASPYAGWSRHKVVAECLIASDKRAAMAELDVLQRLAETHGYIELLGRVHWLRGLVHGFRGEHGHALEEYGAARQVFQKAGDIESEAFVLSLRTESFQVVGDLHGAWRERQRALALLHHVRNPRRRHFLLGEATLACLDVGQPRAASHFGGALVEAAVAWGRPRAVSDALVIRAGIHHALDADGLAAVDVTESRRWIARISEQDAAARLEAEADAVEGATLVGTQPDRAVRSLREALAYFQGAAPFRAPALHLLLARAHAARGFAGEAEGELSAGIEAMESGRTSLRDVALQISFFDQALPLFDDMVRLQVDQHRDPERALAFVERGRARQLVDSLAGAAVSPLDPDRLREELPESVTLVYYVPLDDRLLTWTLSRVGTHFIERSLPAAELSRLVAAYRAGLERRIPEGHFRDTAARLHDELVAPIIPFIPSQRALIFIPDGVLQSVPFAGLWNRQTGRYLVEDHVLGLAASGTSFVRTSTAAARSPRRTGLSALVIGNPRFDRRSWPGLSDLPGAEAEATEIAQLYLRSALLTAGDATKGAFLSRFRVSDVVHYAGHAASSGGIGTAARLHFAPDARTGDSGELYLHELDHEGPPRTRVVVLAACRTGAGAVSRVEGNLSLARPFLALGVPNVVAAMWDIDDSLSHRFFVSLHRALLAEGDALLAIRRAQVGFLRGLDPSLAHPASWAPFICMGGLGPHSLTKGDVS